MHRLTNVTMAIAVATLLLARLPVAQAAGHPQEVPASQAARDVQQQAADKTDNDKFTFDGDTALWAMAIYPGKGDAFEQVMARVRQALENSSDPQRRRQAAGWKVVRLDTGMSDATIGYVHMIHPVVPGADYSIMRILYDAFPGERQALYDLYRGAFARNLSLATGNVAVDLSRRPVASDPAPAISPALPRPPGTLRIIQ